MRLKLSLKQQGLAVRDVQVTADVTATIGDIARYLVEADPARPARVGGEVTLRVEFPGRGQARLLNPLLSVHESVLRSGCTVEVVSPSARRSGDDLYGRPVALVQVISGPGEGAEFTVASGVNYIGRDPASQVVLTDDQVSRRHASITIAESITISDLNSANGVEVDGVLVSRAILTRASRVRIGDSVLRLAQLSEARVRTSHRAPELAVTVEGGDEPDPSAFARSPRVEAAYRGTVTPVPELPGIPEKARFPMLAVIAPVVMGAVLFIVTKQVYSLIFIALSPVIMLGTWIENRSQNKRKSRDEVARFADSLEATRESLLAEREREIAARIAESPSVVEVGEAIRDRSPQLWTRKPEHTTFLEVRFGTGTQASRNTVTAPTKNASSPEDWKKVTALVDDFRMIDAVPVIENLERAGAIGVAGSSPQALDAARSLVVQLVGLHSPADLVVTAFGAGDASAEWSWLKWLPHVDSAFSPLKSRGLAGDFATATALLAELEEIIVQRRAAGVGKGTQVRSRLDEAKSLDAEHGAAVDRLPATPAVVAIVTAESPADRARLVALGEEGPDVGVFLIWLAPTVEQLPVVCRTYLELDPVTWKSRVGFVRSGQTVELDSVEQLDEVAAAEVARLLAPVEDSGAQVVDESDLPHSVGFLDLFDGPVADEPDAVVQRWAKNDSLTASWVLGTHREPGGIRALVGQGPSEPFYLDLRAHGPHALVGGTTGSGKSEFLQAWIMGIAAEYSPDRVTFLLVDYKGGAAFAECATLPHAVGLVTDLNTHLVRRALTSLRAELRYREHLLNSKGAKDLEALEKRSDPDAPPALVIVIDEFAALASEVPEFVDGMIDIAQRGRSLGLHLVMATQRPAGVIKDSLRANTNLRVSLRVADEADSLDVLGVNSAAFFDPGTPGRAAAKLGPGRVLDFQAAYLGGRTGPEGQPTTDVEVAYLEFGRGAGWVSPQVAGARQEGLARDIDRLSGTISSAARRRMLATPRKPWQDQLATIHDLRDLAQPSSDVLMLGIIDEPEFQRQRPFELPLDADANVAVFGTGGSGKSTALRTVAIAASRAAAANPVHIYGLDFSGGGLASLEDLPTVGAIISGGDVERVTRLVTELSARAAERISRYSSARAATLTAYRAIADAPAEPRILVLIDGMSTFRTEYEFHGTVFDEFTKLVAIGRQVGIHFIIAADRLAAFPSALLANIQAKIVLRLAGDTEYAVLGVPDDVLTDAPAGRALVGAHEVQLSVIGGSPDLTAQALSTKELAAELADLTPAPEVERLAEFISITDLPSTVRGRPTIGVSDETLKPVGIPLDGIFVVTGPFGSGRTTAMTTIVQSIRSTRPDLVPYLLVARRSALSSVADWHEASRDSEEAEALATRLAIALEGPIADRDTNLVIVIENIGDFEGLMAEGAVARLIKAARRADVAVIAEADTVTAGSAWQIFSELKTARAGIVLQPEETDGISLFRVQFPRVTRADFPVGRGILVTAGQLARVQVAFPQAEASNEGAHRRVATRS
jgi:S-DNA-T family DNA segregation ATPase FtsK/SpoIIIE